MYLFQTWGDRMLGLVASIMPIFVAISCFGAANGCLFASGRYCIFKFGMYRKKMINLSSVWLGILIEYSLLVFFEAHKTNAHVKKIFILTNCKSKTRYKYFSCIRYILMYMY